MLRIPAVEAQSTGEQRVYGAVIFVTRSVGWLYGGEIFSTTDGGQTWSVQRAWESDGGLPRQMQFIDSQNGWVVYDWGYLHQTTDGGHTWRITQVLAREPNNNFAVGLGRLLMVSPQQGFGLGNMGTHLLRTTDGGRTWRATLIREGDVNFTALSFVDSKHGWVAGIQGMLARTDDGGQTLRQMPTTPIAAPLAMQFVSTSIGWLLDSHDFRLYRTGDGGQHWDACQGPSATPAIHAFVFRTPTQGWAAAAGGVVLRTTDGCASWQAVQTPSTADLNAVQFLDMNYGWAVGDEGTVLKTTDGGLTWTPVQVNVP
jgi:photosystem II stability/assembly factor-like uncharacterized protein